MAVSALTRALRAVSLTGGSCKQVFSKVCATFSHRLSFQSSSRHSYWTDTVILMFLSGFLLWRNGPGNQQVVLSILPSSCQHFCLSMARLPHIFSPGAEQDTLEAERKVHHQTHWHEKDWRPGLDRQAYMFGSLHSAHSTALLVWETKKHTVIAIVSGHPPVACRQCRFCSPHAISSSKLIHWHECVFYNISEMLSPMQERSAHMALVGATNKDTESQISSDCDTKQGKTRSLLRSGSLKSDMIHAGLQTHSALN